MPSDPICRDCPAPATHVLLTHALTWTREAIPAEQAPPVHLSPKVTARPTAYLCAKHAKLKERSHG